ncbi:lytic murein transglycosylase [Roseobacter sp. WL0113]|uniref:Lytic murein transglycosylase n=2 Tax=Roseobacter sinensis TaxID=2931391 RepID=A0ABT3B8K5_9RHOB|nr:lytic murein transglycosylase [Roseobacter sp. WL0113]MCV3269917.1 lytic murein transglycosylase [Roseobacter sp. WL0113]
MVGTSVGALGTTQSLRPVLRPAEQISPAPQPVAVVASAVRPKLRPEQATGPIVPATQVASNSGFERWIRGFEQRAGAQGIRASTLQAAFRGVRYDPDVIRRDRNQSEFTKTIWEYLDSAVSDTRIRNGKAALRQHRRTLDAIEAHYGVDKEVVVAVWGLESAYGEYRGTNDIIQSLATLAYDGRRGAFFEEQLIAALKILQNGDTSPRNMTGSWAGAMGHTQFIPTSYLAYAVDFTGDGRRDIWADDPTDALASTAAYLRRFGWVKGQPWGVEVQLPRGFDYAQANRKITRSPAQWAQLGVVGMDGRAVPNYGQGSILLPAGGQGAAFMIFKNFAVIERYNTADAYVIGVGHLSDRIKGGPAIQASWPRGDRALTFAERKEMQQRLTQAGFSTQGVDGRIGPKTIAAVRAYQRSQGLAPDGYASLSLLKRLR